MRNLFIHSFVCNKRKWKNGQKTTAAYSTVNGSLYHSICNIPDLLWDGKYKNHRKQDSSNNHRQHYILWCFILFEKRKVLNRYHCCTVMLINVNHQLLPIYSMCPHAEWTFPQKWFENWRTENLKCYKPQPYQWCAWIKWLLFAG